MTPHQKKAIEIVAQMRDSWFSNVNRRRKFKCGTTQNEACFDSGVFAAAELVRRLTGDESLSLAVHEALLWKQKERALQTAPPHQP